MFPDFAADIYDKSVKKSELVYRYDKDNYNYMYMVMNTIDPIEGGTQSVTITLDSRITKFYVYDQRGNRSLIEGNAYTVSLTAGQAVYIMPCAF